MTKGTLFKLGQIAGACFMIAGVASCQMGHIENTAVLMLLGTLLYGGCRMAAWLTDKK